MPSDRATNAAAFGPHLVLVGIVLGFVVLIPLRMWFLSGRAIVPIFVVMVAVLSSSFLYQGAFMIRYPSTAVEERIRPPVNSRIPWIRELFTPDSPIGAVLIGLLGVLSAIFGFVLTAVFATALT